MKGSSLTMGLARVARALDHIMSLADGDDARALAAAATALERAFNEAKAVLLAEKDNYESKYNR
jgi:hypothetical protein